MSPFSLIANDRELRYGKLELRDGHAKKASHVECRHEANHGEGHVGVETGVVVAIRVVIAFSFFVLDVACEFQCSVADRGF